MAAGASMGSILPSLSSLPSFPCLPHIPFLALTCVLASMPCHVHANMHASARAVPTHDHVRAGCVTSSLHAHLHAAVLRLQKGVCGP
eukprot:184907-Chlamydomonas_euryale.AAC.10